MSIAAALGDIARGRCPADAALLGNCRLEWGGGEAYGEEAILESFRAAPLDLGSGTLAEARQSALWIGEEVALVADVFDGRVGRLWRLGVGPAPVPEPIVAVAFDPDLRQQRGDVLFRQGDHPELAAGHVGAVTALGRDLAAAADGALHRARAFTIRAFSDGERAATLFALHRLGGGAVRTAGFGYIAALVAPDGTRRTIVDRVEPPVWTPRL